MIKPILISSLNDFLTQVDSQIDVQNEILLFRGQTDNDPLLPNIARDNPSYDTTTIEKEMLEELKRRAPMLISKEYKNDWEWLILAQHFGLKTRLLDWTSNPLVALWFACQNKYKMNQDSFVYLFQTTSNKRIDLTKNSSPFSTTHTQILQPTLNNERIVSQSGWFTAHRYSPKDKMFVSLEANPTLKKSITIFRIPAVQKGDILHRLSRFGVNNRTIFASIEGLCWHLNYKYKV